MGVVTQVTPCMPCSFGPLKSPRSGMRAQPTGLLEMTVTDRYIPLVTAVCGTWVARPARTTTRSSDGDGSQLGRRVTLVCVTHCLVGKPRSGAAADLVVADNKLMRSTRLGPGRTGRSATDRSRFPRCPCRSRTSPCSVPEPARSPRRRAPSRARRRR